jgi:hypothetical protein
MSIMSFIRMMLKKGHLEKNGNNLNRFFNFKFRYIDDGLSTNKCHDFVDRIYSLELEIMVYLIGGTTGNDAAT